MNMQDWIFVDIALLSLCLAIYFLPLIIATAIDHKNRIAIGLLNLFLDWTGVVGSTDLGSDEIKYTII